MTSQMSLYSDFRDGNYQSVNKQNQVSTYIKQPEADEVLMKQFRTLKQINRILDSNPQTNQAKDQKIRSLTILLKKQMDITKKLQSQVLNLNKKLEGQTQQEQIRKNQTNTYEKKVFEQKQKLISLQNENKKLLKVIESNKEQIKVREQFIQKMKQSFNNQKSSMENQIHYLKMKTLEHYNQKLNFPLTNFENEQKIKAKYQNHNIPSSNDIVANYNTERKQRSNSTKRQRSNSTKKSYSTKKQNSKRQNIIQKNILAISKNENELMSGQNLLKTFQNKKQLVQRLDSIRRGNYSSALDARFKF